MTGTGASGALGLGLRALGSPGAPDQTSALRAAPSAFAIVLKPGA